MRKAQANNWLLALLLSFPLLAFFIAYLLNHSSGLIPTGFIQLDNISYIAYARQYLDEPGFHLLYSNPFDIDAPRIYIQPQTLLFALLLKMGAPPGAILIPFTIICSIICFRLIIAIYDHLVKESRFRLLHILFFAWGGGLLALTGMISHPFQNQNDSVWASMFLLDPEGGWWGLNLGRSLLFSCEAYYHALFLGIIYLVLKNSWLKALGLLFLLSVSHPFTGLEILGIISFWGVVELVFRRTSVPVWFVAGSLVILAFHLYFYLYYLEQFPHHRSVREQYSLTWGLRYYRMLPAYVLVGTLALVSIFKSQVRTYFASVNNRLFACWFLVAFLLANHELFVAPKQPIHFTRGYIWTSLFLLGLPALNRLSLYVKDRLGRSGILLLALIMLSDNILWFANQISARTTASGYRYLTSEQQELFRTVDMESNSGTIVICPIPALANLTTVYTSAYPWYAHPFTTPYARKKREAQENLLNKGIPDSSWIRRPLLIILSKTEWDTTVKPLFEKIHSAYPHYSIGHTANYTIIRLNSMKR